MSKRSPYSLVDVNKFVPEQLAPPSAEGGQACHDPSQPCNDPPSPRTGSASPRRPLWLGVDVGKYKLAVCFPTSALICIFARKTAYFQKC